MDEKLIKRMEKMLFLLSENVTNEDFKKAFELVMQYVEGGFAKTEKEVAKILKEIKQIHESVDMKNESVMGGHKAAMTAMQEKMMADLERKITDRLSIVKDGRTPSSDEVTRLLQPLIPEPRDGSPDTAKQVRDKLEALKDDDRLDVSSIKGLEEYVKKNASGEIKYVPTASSGGGIVKAYDLSGSLNGVTKTFALPAFWRVISVHLSSFPNIMRPTVDYTTDASAMSITFTSEIDAPTSLSAGQTLIIIYAE